MGLLVRNGRIITATEDRPADIHAEGETITRIEASIDPASLPSDTEIIDAEGMYVFPGFIDPHVHVYLPFMGTYAKDDYRSISEAALVGGTTSPDEETEPSCDMHQKRGMHHGACAWLRPRPGAEFSCHNDPSLASTPSSSPVAGRNDPAPGTPPKGCRQNSRTHPRCS